MGKNLKFCNYIDENEHKLSEVEITAYDNLTKLKIKTRQFSSLEQNKIYLITNGPLKDNSFKVGNSFIVYCR